MGYKSAKGIYFYTESDTEPNASEMLNRQSNALNALTAVVGGAESMSLPANNALRAATFNLPDGLGGTPTSVIIQSRNPLGHGVQHRVSGVNATTFTVEARQGGTASQLFEFFFQAIR